MGIIKRWYRRIQKEEKYLNVFGRIFWFISILAIGCGMLWTSDTRFSSKKDWYTLISAIEKNVTKDGIPLQTAERQVEHDVEINESLLFVYGKEENNSQIISNKAYVASYNKATKNPNWVSWKLPAEHTDGIHSRKAEQFYEDTRVTSCARPEDYRGSGYDRGHMCPAADNRWDDVAMHESFAMTNICPQNKDLNQNSWNEIEQLCRIWAREYDVIYIVCGPIYTSNHIHRIGRNQVAVPDAFFKAILRMGDDPLGIGFICENESDISKEVVKIATISQIEDITGFTFFVNLPDSLVQKVKGNNRLTRWRRTNKFIRQHNLSL